LSPQCADHAVLLLQRRYTLRVSEQLWFEPAVDGFFVRGVGADMTPVLREQLRALGVDVKKLAPAYPVPVMAKAIDLTIAALYVDRSRAEGLRELGRVFMRGYAQTLVGAAMTQLMKVIGPRRSLERMQRNFRTGTNFIETRFTALGEKAAELWFNDVSGMPELFAGILEAGGRMTGAGDVVVTFAPGPGADCTYRVSWT
jgi:uncharacterized protein (TIGR02265 family)